MRSPAREGQDLEGGREAAVRAANNAVQVFGGAGVSADVPLAALWAGIRSLRLADGPDEVHLASLGQAEVRRPPAL